MGNSESHPVNLPPSHFLPILPHGVPIPIGLDEELVPPPGCPMHKAVPSTSPPPLKLQPPAECPMSASNTSKPSLPSTTRQKPAECPIDHSDDSINPLNQMPRLSQSRLSDAQLAALGTDREISTIPRTLSSTDDPTIPSSSQNWIYPSEQQFYNALVRKGWETPEEEVESMVFIHNHLNEVAWREVLEWEKRRPDHQVGDAELAKFKGRPGELSPRAKMHLWMASIWPDAYSSEPPFDRHDWIIRRPSTQTEHRYIIDYYSAPDDPDGSPNFNLDVRPALDDLGSARMRFSAYMDEWRSGEKEDYKA